MRFIELREQQVVGAKLFWGKPSEIVFVTLLISNKINKKLRQAFVTTPKRDETFSTFTV
jgi:hypothetical protein